MCPFVRTSKSRIKCPDTWLLVTKLSLYLRVSWYAAGLCGSSFPTAKVSNLNNNLFSFVQCVKRTLLSKDGFSQWGSTPLKEWNIRKFHINEYYPKDERILRNSEITELSVFGRRYVAQHYFKILNRYSTSTR